MSGLYAYVDESLRSNRYLLCVVAVDPVRAGHLRRRLRQLLMPGQRRLHFKKEGARRRRELLVAFASLDLDATVYECATCLGRSQEAARSMCLARAVSDLQERGRQVAMMIESRDGLDSRDRLTITAARRSEPPLTFEHLRPNEEPLLWLPDCFAWPAGAGGEWSRRIQPMLSDRVVKVG
jgi:hypothetical protein